MATGLCLVHAPAVLGGTSPPVADGATSPVMNNIQPPENVGADYFGVNAERPHEDVYNSDILAAANQYGDDYSIEATVKINETSTANGTAGLIVRSGGDDQNFYYFGIYPNEDKWKLYKPGFPEPVEGSYQIGLAPQAYDLKVTAAGSTITAYINGAQVGSLDDTLLPNGGAGLRIRSSDASFSGVRINGAAQDLAGWSASHAVAWTETSGSAARGNVLLDPSLLASPELSPGLDQRFRMLVAMGASQVRFMLSWAEIQPQSSSQPYSWRYADAFAIAAHRYDLEIVPIALFAPRWAVRPEFRDSVFYHAYPPVDNSGNLDTTSFAQFVASATGRYKRGGQLAVQMGWGTDGYGQAASFEIGSEFNLGIVYEKKSGQWQATGAGWLGSLSQFVDLLKAGHDAVKGVCPDCLVLNGAPADDVITNYDLGDDSARHDSYVPYLDSNRLLNPDGTPAWRQTVWQGVDDLYSEIERRPAPDNLPAKYFDVLNVHTFMWKGYSADWPITSDRYVSCSYYSDDCWKQWYDVRLQQIVQAMHTHNDSRQIWLSETGFPSARPPDDSEGFLGFLSEEKQARALESAYAEAAKFPDVKKVFWWQGYDCDYSGNLGLVRDDLSAKPSYAAYGWMAGRNLTFRSGFSYSWYDNTEAANWVLMANPASAAGAAKFDLAIGGRQKGMPSLAGQPPGEVPRGSILYARYPGVIGGPVYAGYEARSGAISSERTLWAGNSLEEVPGTENSRLSDHFYWSWYDEQTPGCKDWLLVANPASTPVYYRIRIAGADVMTGQAAPGEIVTSRFPGVMGGPVEVQAWSDAIDGGQPAEVMASQRVLSNGDKAFNEMPGIPAAELGSDYYWTWYDMQSAGARNWVLIANPPGAAAIYYEIKIGGNTVRSGGPIYSGKSEAPVFPGTMGGPVEVRTFSDPGHQSAANSIASQRLIWGPSFEEVPGLPEVELSADYHWTWYDMQSAGSRNWVIVAAPAGAPPIYYTIWMGGAPAGSGGPISGGQNQAIAFPGYMGGPVEVSTYADAGHTIAADSLTSQRVLWNGYINEVVGTTLD